MGIANNHHFTIGALAKKAQVAIDTIRYYEREGLLPQPHRRASGYREYDVNAIERVRFIRRAKELGFTLDEIRDLLMLEGDRDHGVEGVKQRAMKRLAELNQRVIQMTEMRDGLALLIDACPGQGEPECCPILSSMHGVEAAVDTSPKSSCCGSKAGHTQEKRE